ncbi:hypothetical protein N7508_003289 [Penicillium antarcticum]|uniref:uncharacterized protein n=1 Tax=Penicillium antarcticum TaxID=416450 RepID=UPI00238A22DD|nr:uncharacterized protein N7508_003289 [Penicillium antarcticum]KAJ5312459.1 hypothetical protein N7508_003289 [Penicillium antarcticum]
MKLEEEEEDSASSDEEVAPQITATAQRRAQNVMFSTLLAQHVLSDLVQPEERPRTISDAELSTARLLAKQGGGAALDPREYQIELFERAKAQNTIAVLDTGSGKTLIAVLLLKHIIQNELMGRGNGAQHRVSFFLVDSVTLVFQQSAVLRNNIDQKVAHFFGDLGADLWDKVTWKKYLETYMVIVCTAEILNQALLNGHIRMDQINLLIFDEAHHAKKEHPYARIIREAYLSMEVEKRPRILGMTASPVDAKCDIAEAATKLETLLDSRIATTADLSLLRHFVSRPKEEEWVYQVLHSPSETELHGALKVKFGHLSILGNLFQFALHASSELGGWCADKVWPLALATEMLPKLEGQIAKNADVNFETSNQASKEIKEIQDANEFVKAYMANQSSEPGDLSSKVQLLVKKLEEQFKRAPETKCIVFVQRRNTAKILLQLCKRLQIPNLRPDVLVGVRKEDTVGMNSTFRIQFLTLIKFRQGGLNCLFATSVAEEGLDIPDCNLVVRFDLYNTVIQYVQSRGRARHSDSIYATMIEAGNESHERRQQEVRKAEALMRKFCNVLPKDRLLKGTEHDLDEVLREAHLNRTYTIHETGAKLTYRHAIDVLGRFASSLQYEKELSAQATYIVAAQNEKFSCEVILPEKSPIRGVLGNPESKKSLAKQAAAFDLCLLLRRNHLLDDHFNSVYHKRLPAMRNAKLALTAKKTYKYAMRTKPSVWTRNQGTIPKCLFATFISIASSTPLTRDHGSIVLLTRERLPFMPAFPVFLEFDIETTVNLTGTEGLLNVSPAEVDLLTVFTLSVFHDLFHKTYTREPERFPYWIAPAQEKIRPTNSLSISDIIDWGALKYASDNQNRLWSPDMKPESLLSRFIYDNWNGKYRYLPISIDQTLSPTDPVPSYVPGRKWMKDIMNWTLSLSKNSRPKFFEQCIWDQPVLQAETVCLRRNFLEKASEEERSVNVEAVICPQPLRISAIPLPVATTCLIFPAIISRIESCLIVQEGCQMLGLDIKSEYALEAFTKDSDNTEEHRGLQIHIQRGMGKNYERLELLGDSVLKMATSISLFAQNPDDNEYDYHVNRMCLICNKNLFATATQKKVYEWIRSRGFSRHMWYPPGLVLEYGRDHAKFIESEGRHVLSEKTMADVCEALIGASLLSGGSDNRFDMSIKAVTLFANHSSHTAMRWEDYIKSYKLPSYQISRPDAVDLDLARQIERLGYNFKYPRLLRSAFMHPSVPSSWAQVPCYQRLEFLGDALFDLVCVEHLFHRFPTRDPQWLTEHKMAMVSNKFLGALAVKLNLHPSLQHASAPLLSQTTRYADALQIAESESNGEMDYWVSAPDSPKALPDMVEAYVGAIFVDSGFDLTVVEKFFEMHVLPFFSDMSIYDTFANRHPTTYLHAMIGQEFRCNSYCLKSGEIPGVDGEPPTILAIVMVHGEAVAKAAATSSRYAKIKASSKALEALEAMTRIEFRAKYECDCKDDEEIVQAVDIGTAV